MNCSAKNTTHTAFSQKISVLKFVSPTIILNLELKFVVTIIWASSLTGWVKQQYHRAVCLTLASSKPAGITNVWARTSSKQQGQEVLLEQAASQGTLLLHVHQSIPDTVIMSQSLWQQLFSHSLKLIKSRAFFQEITLIIQGFNKALKIKYLQLEKEGRGRGKGER